MSAVAELSRTRLGAATAVKMPNIAKTVRISIKV